ncbi:MAG: glycine--tRNA ligase subunit beta [Alphaproteobacteria bacterium]
MPSFLLEFFSEEIPARMQKRAEEDLARMLGAAFEAAGLGKVALRTLSGPRRIAVLADDIPARAADVNEERKGPRVGAPEKALEGFLKAAGLSKIEDAEIQKDPKGDFYVARIARKGRSTPEIVADAVPKIAKDFPWPKSMRSGSSDFIWVRPLHGVLCLFDGEPVRFEIGGVKSGVQTWGHRFHSSGAITIANAAEYEGKLRGAYVLADREARKAKILADAKAACAALRLELVEDAGLLEEVAGLAEWPVVVLGDMDPDFLDLPAEVIRLTMRTHQRYFAVREPSGKLAPHFITVANVEPRDGGKAIAAGNARVLSARLNDARFFWDGDRKIKLEDRVAKLDQIVFHAKLGSVGDKVKRVRALARELAPLVGANPELADRAALLAKADLVTETVGEFPELQGQMGRQLAELEGENKSVAIAIEDHYRPVGPNDRVPTDPVAIAVALADKLDTLVGFWAIDEKPTGSRDPYALRRSALGIVRILLESKARFHLRSWFERAWFALVFQASPSVWPYQVARALRLEYAEGLTEFAPVAPPADLISAHSQQILTRAEFMGNVEALNSGAQIYCYEPTENGVFSNRHVLSLGAHLEAESCAICQYQVVTELLAFLADRLKVQLRDQGKRHDLVDAVFALGDDDLVRIVARVEALDKFLKTEDGANILAGYRRAANILAAEDKKGQGLTDVDVSGAYQVSVLDKNPQLAERALLEAVNRIGPQARALVEKEQFEGAMTALAGLRAPLDLFFEQVLVNDPIKEVRKNRLLLLTQIRDALSAVADFSKIEG